MGIKSLNKFLRESFPNVFENIHISEYRYKKIAIDITLYLCHFKVNFGEERWFMGFLNLVKTLREYEIHCVFIFDNGYPPEKQEERKQRMLQRAKTEEKVFKLEQAIEKYEENGQIENVLIEFQNKKNINPVRILNKKSTNNININAIKYLVKKMRRQLFTISKEDYQLIRELFDILDVPYYNSPLEAETMCADLCIQGKVDAVLTEDTDVLAYASPVFLSNYRDGYCTRINTENLFNQMELTSDEFLDFCIMCGTDYNKNIFKVGPSKSYKYILEHKNIDKLKSNTSLDISNLNHIRVRQLFREYERFQGKISYCGIPDFNKLELLLVKKNIKMDIDNLKDSFVTKIELSTEDETIESDDLEMQVYQ
jgi:5'-3' exonuclease